MRPVTAAAATDSGQRRIAGLSGKDPAADWSASKELRDHWQNRGGERAFKRYASMCLTNKDDYTVVFD